LHKRTVQTEQEQEDEETHIELKFVFESIAYLSVNVVIERPVSDTRGGTACCSGQIVGSCNC
jgi:hypothetical protein